LSSQRFVSPRAEQPLPDYKVMPIKNPFIYSNVVREVERRIGMCSCNPLLFWEAALAVTFGVAGATAISDGAAHRLGVLGVPLGLLIASVSIVLYGLMAPYRERKRAKVLRGIIALVFAVDVVYVSALLVGTGAGADVAFWRRWALAAHVISIMLVAFDADTFLNKKEAGR